MEDRRFEPRTGTSIARHLSLGGGSAEGIINVVVEGDEYRFDLNNQGWKGQLIVREQTYELDGDEGRLEIKIVCHRTPTPSGKRMVTVGLKNIAIVSPATR